MYLKQDTNFDCGPIAVMNYLLWLGFPVKKADLKHVRRMLGTNTDGTSALNIFAAISSMQEDACFCIGMRGWNMAMRHLRRGQPVLLAYKLKTPHIVFMIRQGKHILITNMSKKQPHVLMTRKFLKKLLKKSTSQPIFILG